MTYMTNMSELIFYFVAQADVRATLRYTVDGGQRHHNVVYQPTMEEGAARGFPEDMSKNLLMAWKRLCAIAAVSF